MLFPTIERKSRARDARVETMVNGVAGSTEVDSLQQSIPYVPCEKLCDQKSEMKSEASFTSMTLIFLL